MVFSYCSFLWQLAWSLVLYLSTRGKSSVFSYLQLPQLRERIQEVLPLKCVFLFSMTKKFGIKRVCAIILSYCTWKNIYFQTPFFSSIFSRWNQAWNISIWHFFHTLTRKSQFLPDLKCNSYRVVPIILVNMMPLSWCLVTIIYNLWIQPRNKAKRKWT